MAVQRISDGQALLSMRQAIEDVHVEDDIERYIVQLVHHTRTDTRVAVGSSPRGSLAMLKLARAYAAIEGRDYVLPDDVKRFAKPALLHRLILNPELWLRRNAPDQVLTGIINNVAVPVVQGA
jgi:MoxR-like ATPase